MIKSGLKIYKNNIWEVFALLGFISIGLLIGVFVIYPLTHSLIVNSIGQVGSAVSTAGAKLDLAKFGGEMQNRIAQLDWSNPIRAIKILFENNGLFDIIVSSLEKCGVDSTQIGKITESIHDVCHDFIFGFTDIVLIFILIIGATGLIGCFFLRILIQARSTSNRNVGKFILTYLANILIVALIFFLLILTIVSLSGASLFLSLIAIFLALLLLSLISSILIYKEKTASFIELFNLKSLGFLLLSSLIIVGISGLVIILVYLLCDFVALYISLPLLIVTFIVIENITIKYVTDFKLGKNN